MTNYRFQRSHPVLGRDCKQRTIFRCSLSTIHEGHCASDCRPQEGGDRNESSKDTRLSGRSTAHSTAVAAAAADAQCDYSTTATSVPPAAAISTTKRTQSASWSMVNAKQQPNNARTANTCTTSNSTSNSQAATAIAQKMSWTPVRCQTRRT